MNETIEYKNRISPIIYRRKGSEKTDPCPYCNTPHIHGSNAGHRVAHCTDKDWRPFKADDHVFYPAKDGYVIVEY